MSEEDLAGWRQGGLENRGAADPQFSVPARSRSMQDPVMLDPAGYGGVPETFIRSFVSDKGFMHVNMNVETGRKNVSSGRQLALCLTR